MTQQQKRAGFRDRIKPLIDFNKKLEQSTPCWALNEALLEKRLRQLEKLDLSGRPLYWLAFARITELTLLCAGNYADNLEFAAAGDLLVNPRLILIHSRTGGKIYIKERHKLLTEQFSHISTTKRSLDRWLKEETIIEIKKAPLLPHMYGRLRESEYLSVEYVKTVERRMKKVSETIGFFGAWHLGDSIHLQQRIKESPLKERALVKSKFCRFNKNLFLELGRDLKQLIQNKNHQSGFLNNSSELLGLSEVNVG